MSDRDGDQYPEFGASIKQRFNAVVGNGRPLFTTDAADLFDIFLLALPAEARQHYTCNACRHFVTHYGGLVLISESGAVTPAIWDMDVAPEFFRDAVRAMRMAILNSKVTGVFLSDKAVLGTPVTGEWEHMSVTLPQGMLHTSRLKTPGQVMAEKLQDYLMLTAALREYSATVIDQAVTLLKSETLYRSDKVLGVAEWFKGLKERLERKASERQANLKWLAVGTAPAGFCHVRSSMIGTLLSDLAAGMTIDAVGRRFKEKMDPLQYMRPQAAPTQGNIEQAEKIVEKLGIANSLKRRYARFEEIPHFLWRAVAKVEESTTNGVFGHLTPKGASKPEIMNLPSTTMTWEKFQRTILPEAEAVEATASNGGSFMALVTAVDMDAPNILRWNNTFSWYFRPRASHASWNMSSGRFVKVTGITETPNLWGDAPVTHAGHKIFFLLEGCRDVANSPGGGFFPEFLKAELHEVRSTLEAYANNALIEESDTADACGVGYSKDSKWDLTLKVTANNSTRVIKIDRWD